MREFVFISHASNDKQHLGPLLQHLIKEGVKIWIDDPFSLDYNTAQVEQYFVRLHAGNPWNQEIDEALEKSGAVLAIWSKTVVERFTSGEWDAGHVLRKEIEYGYKKNKLVCARIDDSDPTKYPSPFDKEQISDISPGNNHKVRLDGLATDVKRKLRLAALRAYRADRIEEWSQPRYGAGDKLFTDLALLLDRGADADERWQRQKETYNSLDAVLKGNPDHRALVLLGAPGSGKSTLLRHLDLEIAQSALSASSRSEEQTAPFSYFVSLRDYRGAPGACPPEPMEWLKQTWESQWRAAHRFPNMPTLEKLLAKRETYLLLDALNEMPHGTTEEYEELVGLWARFIPEILRYDRCRVIFSCRSLIYSNRLSTRDTMVPHVNILPLSRETREKFLRHYAPIKVDDMLYQIEGSDQQEKLYSVSYYLKMLVEVVRKDGRIPNNRASLMTAYVRKLLKREFDANTGAVTSFFLGNEQQRLRDLFHLGEGWQSPYELPDQSRLFPILAEFAYDLQDRGAAGGQTSERFQIVIDYGEAIQWLSQKLNSHEIAIGNSVEDAARAFIQAASHLTILEHKRAEDKVQFYHQLMQEYFAGRKVAASPKPERVRVEWEIGKVAKSLEEVCRNWHINEPLPMLDGTGWEETMLFAAPMADDRNAFIAGLRDANLPLAARAAASIRGGKAAAAGGGGAPLSKELRSELQRLLLKRMEHTAADLRARIVAGKALGELGDPRLTYVRKDQYVRKGQANIEALVPPLIEVPAGTYRIGTDKPWHKHEAPSHGVTLARFEIAQFPVTNAEWQRFMDASGYDDVRWWRTDASKKWRAGETTRDARDAQWWAFRRMLQDNPDYIERKLDTGELSPRAAEDHRTAMDLSDEQFEEELEEAFQRSLRRGETGRHTEPRRWRNLAFNNPSQPVVGICWFEVDAYCAWLSAQTGECWRLPSEAEWEVAARLSAGGDEWDYPWGTTFDETRCNSFETHIRATTPVGVFSRAASASGWKWLLSLFRRSHSELIDISGNAYEWTSSKYFPYCAGDGREEREDPEDNAREYVHRVLRGGSWYYSKDEARIAFRLRFHPGYHNQSTGFRLVRAA